MGQVNLITKYKNKLLNIIIGIIALVIVYVIYQNQVKNTDALNARKDIEIKKNEALSSILQSEGKINVFKKVLNRKDMSLVMNAITDIAKDSNIKIISIKPTAEKNYPVYIKYPFDLVIGADTYHAIGKFISNIEHSLNGIFFIDKATIGLSENVQEKGVANKLIINLTISTVVFKN